MNSAPLDPRRHYVDDAHAGSGGAPVDLYTIGSLDMGLRALTVLLERDVTTVTGLALRLGVARSRAHRTLRTLERDGFVSPAATGRGFVIGPRLLALSAPHGSDPVLRSAHRSVIGAVREGIGEAVHTAVLLGDQLLVTDGRRSTHDVDIGLRIGMIMPAHAMAGGKLLLSYLDDNQVLALFPDARLAQVGPNTIRDRHELLENLNLIRRRSFATTLQESERGVDSLAVLLSGTSWRDRSALVVSVPASRGGKAQIERLANQVLGIVSQHRADQGDGVTLAK
jgi:IclR family acetate operon transcriptional repressor